MTYQQKHRIGMRAVPLAQLRAQQQAAYEAMKARTEHLIACGYVYDPLTDCWVAPSMAPEDLIKHLKEMQDNVQLV